VEVYNLGTNSAMTNSQSTDQTVRARIRFGTAGDVRRSITVNLYESFMFYKHMHREEKPTRCE